MKRKNVASSFLIVNSPLSVFIFRTLLSFFFVFILFNESLRYSLCHTDQIGRNG